VPFSWLIDGYNLMGALGLIQGTLPAKGLEKGRVHILDLLADKYGDAAGDVLVIFDAARSPRRASPEQEHRGIQVRFAKGRAEADDLLEELIEEHRHPKKLTVVSSDHRVQRAARRRNVRALDCHAFLDWLERPPPQDAGENDVSEHGQDKPAAAETAHWMRLFGSLKDDPEVKELFDDFGTGEGFS